MKKFLKDNSYGMFLGVCLVYLFNLTFLDWELYLILFGVAFLVTWKCDKEQ